MANDNEPGSRPRDAAAALERVDAALTAGQTGTALTEVEAALQRWPDDADLLHARGVGLRLSGMPDDALESFQAALRRDPHLADAYLDAAEVLVEDLDDEVAALDLLAQARRHVSQPQQLAEIELLRGMALAQLSDFTGALAALDAAARHEPTHPDVHAERGGVLLELLRLDEAEAALRRSLELSDESARAHELLGFLLDYSGRRDDGMRHFRRAGELDEELPPEPPRLTEGEFDQALDKAISALPTEFAQRLANVEVSVENYASKDFCRRHDCSPTVLGIHVGTPMPERLVSQPQGLPDRIVLFQRALENACRDRDEVVDEIVVTLKHEVGHLLGFSEEELHERGYE